MKYGSHTRLEGTLLHFCYHRERERVYQRDFFVVFYFVVDVGSLGFVASSSSPFLSHSSPYYYYTLCIYYYSDNDCNININIF